MGLGRRLALTTLALLAWLPGTTSGWAQGETPVANAGARFERAWRLVDERYWDLEHLDVDWASVRDRFEPRARAAPDEAALHAVLGEMVALLDDDHSRYVAPDEVERVREAYGDLPCIGVFSQADPTASSSGPVRWRLDAGLGVIRVEDLARGGTSSGVRAAVVDLERRGARGLALDLRGNPGGRLIEMMTTAGVFVRGLLWRVATRWSLPIPYPALGAPATDLPVAVLVDGQVASAAEGLAGALQASGRAIVVGERTSGNVEAVLPFCLRDGAQIWLATGVLAPIGGPTWEGRGVVPDIASEPGRAEKAAREALLGRD
ncbi:MAG: S41 family peptidase [Trueperaceae bacterium]|nr:S41 family peptidase [Trueperaceae bacterium]